MADDIDMSEGFKHYVSEDDTQTCVQRIAALERALEVQKEDNRKLADEINRMAKERDDLKAKLAAAMADCEKKRTLGRVEAFAIAQDCVLVEAMDCGCSQRIILRIASERAKISGPSATEDTAQNQGDRK